MDELLEKLFESELLTEEAKTELKNAATAKIEEAVQTAKTEVEASVRAELATQWVNERDALVEAIDEKVSSLLEAEMSELKEDLESFRDLEVEHAVRINEEKQELRTELDSDLEQLVEKMDSFIEIRLNSEIEELHEDIQEQKKFKFGKKVFEAIESEYKQFYAGSESVEGKLTEAETELSDVKTALRESESALAKYERAETLSKVLAPLSGNPREIMETILQNVATTQLQEGYDTFIHRVLTETTQSATDTFDSVITEGKVQKDAKCGNEERFATEEEEKAFKTKFGKKYKTEMKKAGYICESDTTTVSGNETLSEQFDQELSSTELLSESAKNRIRTLAGLA